MFDTQKLQMTIQSLNREGRFASEKTFLHHRKITVYDHSVHVAEIILVRYLNLEDCGEVLGRGCGTPGMTKRSKYPEQAYRLGKSLV